MDIKEVIADIAKRYTWVIKLDAIDHPSLPQCESLVRAALDELAEKMEYEKAIQAGKIPRISTEEQERREQTGMCNDI